MPWGNLFKHLLIRSLCLDLLILAGCTTLDQVQIEVLVPAEISLPGEVRTLGIIDRSPLFIPDTLFAAETDKYLENNHLDREEIAESVLSGFTDVLNVSPRFTCRWIDPALPVLNDTAYYINQSGWDQIRQVCHDSILDALVVLRHTDIYDEVYLRWDPAAGKESGPYIYLSNSWRIYDPIEMIILDDYTYTDSTYSLSEDDYLEYLFRLPLDRKPEALDACFWSGQKYAFRITPLWETVSRKYYTWSGDVSVRAKQFVREDDWLSAARLWNQETKNPKVSLAGKACFNMALASETEDKLEMAIYWAKKSDSLLPAKIITEDYIRLLEDRLKERNKLDLQMGNEND